MPAYIVARKHHGWSPPARVGQKTLSTPKTAKTQDYLNGAGQDHCSTTFCCSIVVWAVRKLALPGLESSLNQGANAPSRSTKVSLHPCTLPRNQISTMDAHVQPAVPLPGLHVQTLCSMPIAAVGVLCLCVRLLIPKAGFETDVGSATARTHKD